MSDSSTEVKDSIVPPEDSSLDCSKKPMRSYTREFLLSLSELEICKKLPEGFDASLLSEFDFASDGFQDRHRVPRTLSVQGYKRTDFGSSVPDIGDTSNYSRGSNRWDGRSIGRSDTDMDSESGRCYGNQPRISWQNPEHDGLLGSGSFPRPSGYALGAPVQRFWPGDNAHLNRSNGPYHPPRPYKAGLHFRREPNDSFNDETFGSADDASEDRVEEEKKRRAEFELMRKEQHKALQDYQKSNQGKTDDPLCDIGLLDNPSDGKISRDLDTISKQAPQNECIKVPVSSQAPPYRPLVPPGFVSSVADKSATSKSLVHPEPLEMGKVELEDSHQNLKNRAQGRALNSLHSHPSGTSDIKAEKVLDLASVVEGVDHANSPRLPDVNEILENGEIIGLDFEVSGPKLVHDPARSTSILDKLFGNTLTASKGSTSNIVEDDPKTQDIRSSNTVLSKFAHWFPEEERKPPGKLPFENPNTLLSLIADGGKGGLNVSDVSSKRSIVNPEHTLSNSASYTTVIIEQISNSYVTEAKPAVMTCEDLEQSMLSKIGRVSPNSRAEENDHHALEVKVRQHANDVDNQASQHLLSLLQKPSESKDAPFTSVIKDRTPEKPISQEVCKLGALDGRVNDGDGLNNPAKTLTLEALFGSAFMKELHSVQRSAIDSTIIDASGGALFPSPMNVNGSNHLAPNDGNTKMDTIGDLLGFNDALLEVELSKRPGKLDSKFSGMDRGIEVTLPEEDSLINLDSPVNAENSMLAPSSSSIPVDLFEKLAALGGDPRDRSMLSGHDPHLLRGPFDVLNLERSYQNMHLQASSPQLHASQINYNHSRPLFHALDTHPANLGPQLNFMPPEGIIHRDPTTHHQFPPNMGHPSFLHPSVGVPGFDRPVPPALQQIHMAGNVPPPPLGRGLPGAAPMPPRLSHNPANYIHEPNAIQNFSFGQRLSHTGGPGIGTTGPELGVADSHPEAFLRLMEMELRAKQKQMHPHLFAAGAPSRAMYGNGLETEFRYR